MQQNTVCQDSPFGHAIMISNYRAIGENVQHRESAYLRYLALILLLTLSLWTACLAAQDANQGSPGKLSRVRMDGTYFERDGKRFLVIGAHWVPAKAAMQWPLQWDPKDIEADFVKMHDLGYNMVRIDMMWAWFEPRPGDYNPEAFRQLDYLISLGHRYKIYIHPSLFIGGEVGEAYWDVAWRHGRHPHSDPEMLRLETNLAAEFGRRYANETGIIAWDLTDEPPFWIVQEQTTDAMAINWTRLITTALRRNDKMHPILIGTSQEDLEHGPFRPDNIAPDVDLFSVHPFSIYNQSLFPDPMLSQRGTYGAAFQIALSSGAGHPAMIHEMGASSAQYSPERIASYERTMLYSGLAAGSPGFSLWAFTDAAPEQYRKAPYLRTPQETQWGMTTWDRQDRPRGREYRKLSQVLAQMDMTGVTPALADVGIIVPYEWEKPHGDFSHFGLTGPEITPYVSLFDGDAVPGQPQPNLKEDIQWLRSSWLNSFILARQAGLKADFPRELTDWQKHPMIFMPSPITSTASYLVHVHSDFWEKAQKYVTQGGFLYASVGADAAIPEMEQLFGARLADTVTDSEVTLKIVAPLGDLKPGDTFHYAVPAGARYWGALLEVKGGQVIAVDQEGRPALVANIVGAGKTLLSAYPLEVYLANVPSVFEKTQDSYRIYQAFRDWAGVKPLFRTDQPSVEVNSLNAQGRGYAVLVNHSGKTQKINVSTILPIHSLSQLSPPGARPLTMNGSAWQMELGPYDGAVVTWK
jgi:endo-1,4-beta-mannosidase